MEKIVEKFLEKGFITRRELKKLNYTFYDRKLLINLGKLEKYKFGKYTVSVEVLNKESNNYFKNKAYSKALLCCTKILRKDPTEYKPLFILFKNFLYEENFDICLKLYDVAMKYGTEETLRNFKLYLYLLDQIIILPKKYKEEIKELTVSDITSDLDKHKDIKEKLLTGKITEVGRELFLDESFLSINLKNIKILIRLINKNATLVNNEVSKLIKEEKYIAAKEYLENNALNSTNKLILRLLKVIVDIDKNEYPQIKLSNTTSFDEALADNDFRLASNLYNGDNKLITDLFQIINSKLVNVYEKLDKELMVKNKVENINEIVNRRKEIMILGPLENDELNSLKEETKKYSNLVSFWIENDYGKFLVFKYLIKKDIDLSWLYVYEAKEDLIEKRINNAIKSYQNALYYGQNLPYIYQSIGLCYLKTKQKKKAIEYLTVAEGLYLRANKNFSKKKVLNTLVNCATKPEVKMTEDSFDDNKPKVDYINDLTKYILENDLDVETAALDFGIIGVDLTKVYIRYAREFYKMGYTEKGDEFLSIAEHSSYKDKYINSLIKELRKNRKLIISKEYDKTLELTRTLKPFRTDE